MDSQGKTIDFFLTARRDTEAAKRFFIKALKASHTQSPRVINVDKNPSYRPAIEQLLKSGILPEDTELRQVKYLNNMVKQDHRGVKHLINLGMSFGSFNSARKTLKGYEAMNMLRKGQIQKETVCQWQIELRFSNGSEREQVLPLLDSIKISTGKPGRPRRRFSVLAADKGLARM